MQAMNRLTTKVLATAAVTAVAFGIGITASSGTAGASEQDPGPSTAPQERAPKPGGDSASSAKSRVPSVKLRGRQILVQFDCKQDGKVAIRRGRRGARLATGPSACRDGHGRAALRLSNDDARRAQRRGSPVTVELREAGRSVRTTLLLKRFHRQESGGPQARSSAFAPTEALCWAFSSIKEVDIWVNNYATFGKPVGTRLKWRSVVWSAQRSRWLTSAAGFYSHTAGYASNYLVQWWTAGWKDTLYPRIDVYYASGGYIGRFTPLVNFGYGTRDAGSSGCYFPFLITI